MSRLVDDGAVENVYRLQVMNASLHAHPLRLQALTDEGPAATALQVGYQGPLSVAAAGATTLVVTVRMSATQAQAHRANRVVPIRFVIADDAAGASAQATTTFLPG
ncbi:MAG: hypothetical protein CFE45_30740 [Burkholderiales bacterium PBB5]|nr:MAG: hypothetical protein CFE45_30740 [Burkholderiales bacterium PBB5]